MVKKKYALRPEDQTKLISMAIRYRAIRTSIDEVHGTMTVWTTFVDSNEPTSIANEFKLDVVSNDPPRMPEEEYRRRAEGKP